MKRVEVLIPFNAGTKKLKAGDKVNLPEDVIERALAINPNMVLVLGEAKTKKK